ncbi:MAG TPA: Ig domain-containing protein [Acidimicrobiales bacterium]
MTYALGNSGASTIEVSGTINDNVVVDSQAVTIEQNPAGSLAVIDGTGNGPVITTEGNAVLTVDQLRLTGGSAPSGGGVFLDGGDVDITDSVISGNTATDSGGGIGDDGSSSASFNLTNSTVSGNSALGSGTIGGTGGGIAVGPLGNATIVRSTISSNTAGGVGSGTAGGGGDVNVGGGQFIINSTISGNTATGSGASGGGVNVQGGDVTIAVSTISGNAATVGGVAIANADANGVSVAGDILARAGGAPAAGECQGHALTDLGYNVDDDGTCGLSGSNHSVSDSATIGGFLGPLQNNGGPTDTIALSGGTANPAQAVIPLSFTMPPVSEVACRLPDQRGVARGAPCDMGAYALTTGVPPAITSSTTANFTAGTQSTFSFTAMGSPPPTFSETGQLPTGLSLSTGGLLSGTPAAGAAGVYSIAVTATNGVSPDAHQTFTIHVASAPPPPPPPSHGYWLVGSDGGIFSFGSAQFYGSTGSLRLQRPVVGIVPTRDRGGYWLDASDGGVFSFGDTQFYGSIPGLGLHPAGSGLPNSLNAPIVGMVPSRDQGGYFMVASDGGVFAFGDAHFAGSCPGMGGCSGAAVAVMPDASGNGYWLITQTGSVYTFGDAPYLGAPGPQSSPITSAVATPDGKGYWILDGGGQVFPYGDAANLGSVAAGATGGLNPATAIFTTSDGNGYWVVDAVGKVFTFGDAPNDGDMSGTQLNGPIIAASGS